MSPLDGLRGVAIGCVLIAHASISQGFPSYPFTKHLHFFGPFGVHLFFVISGFIITRLLITELHGGYYSRIKFYFRRAFRILPPLWAYFIGITLLNFLSGDVILPQQSLLISFFFLANIFSPHHWLVGHTWSLAVEEQFYLIHPNLINGDHVIITIVVIAILISAPAMRAASILDVHWPAESLYGFIQYSDALAYGSIAALILAKNKVPSWISNPYYVISAFGLAFVIFVAGLKGDDIGAWVHGPGYSLAFIGFSFIVLHAFMVKKSWLVKMLSLKPFVWMGLLSYSLYLWQQYFLYPEQWVELRHWYRMFPQNLLFSFLFGLSSYYLIEKTSLKYRNKLDAKFWPK